MTGDPYPDAIILQRCDHVLMRCNNSVAVFNVALAASPEAVGKSSSTFVDPALSLNEGGKRFGVGLVLHRG
jgi:hypothetical protein